MLKAIANFFFVNRGLLHSDRWLREPFTRGQAWVDLFGLAQHSDGYMRIRGARVELKRGQLGYSQLSLSKRWKWSRDKVRRYLRELENDGDIIQQTTQVTTVISIAYYNTWQGKPDEPIQQTIQQTIQQPDNRKTSNDTHTNKSNTDNKKNNNVSRRFTPPTLDDIKSLIQERGYTVDAERFLNFYASKGWMVGRSKMKDWKAAIAGWESRDKKPRELTNAEKLARYEKETEEMLDRSHSR